MFKITLNVIIESNKLFAIIFPKKKKKHCFSIRYKFIKDKKIINYFIDWYKDYLISCI